jgi:hypothetical protein
MKYFLFLLVILFTCNKTFSQVKAEKIELIEMINDLFVTKKNESNIKQVWWIPQEYWEVSLNDSKYSNQALQDEIKGILKNYIIVIATDVDIKPYGSLKGNEITISLTGTDNQTYSPIEKDKSSEEVFSLLDVLKPTMKNMLGQFGEKMNYFVFKKRNAKNNIIAGPLQRGQMAININNEDFIFRLPLGSMVEKKICPIDDELLNGNWEYCPWHGKKLIEK